MSELLKTGIRNALNVLRYLYGFGTIAEVRDLLNERRKKSQGKVVFFVDDYFQQNGLLVNLNAIEHEDLVLFVDTTNEPTTALIDQLCAQVRSETIRQPCAIVGLGGGATMDVAKAVSNLLTNGGKAKEYQGWDLVRTAGIYKIGVPTISGTGAETTRTCVMTNPANGLKLGMNSDHTVFDQIVMDPDLTATVPNEQYFYTGMDAYIHCMESLGGSYRNAIGDAYSEQAIRMCRKVFYSRDMMSDTNRAHLMVASYLGGCAIATSYVGVVHPFSAGLSVVLGVHHCVGNCIAMRAMQEFYPEGYDEFWKMAEMQNVSIPKGMCRDLSEEQYERLYAATIIHEKPLVNALGEKFRDILSREKVTALFKRM